MISSSKHGKGVDMSISNYLGNNDQLIVIYDPEEAKRLAGDDENELDGYEYWPRLTEDEYVKLDFHCPHWLYSKVDDVLVSPSRIEAANEKLEYTIPFIWDDISAVIRYCLANRNSLHPRPFFDMVEQAYLDGGWPCGWQGKYPEGKLVVFTSHKETLNTGGGMKNKSVLPDELMENANVAK
jgi:hypothetical protein